jgi:dolichol-phosphate mannosyltransferase
MERSTRTTDSAVKGAGSRLDSHHQELSNMSGADRELISRLGKFLVVGGSGLIVNNAALIAGHQLLRLPLAVASVCAVVLAVVNNFVLNDRWTFAQSGLSARRFVRFFIGSLGGMAITSTTLWLLVTYFQMHYLVANLIGITMGAGANFLVSATWTWAGSSGR